MRRLFDQHIHTQFSGDCEEPMEEVAESAASLGLAGICFTDHMDLDYPGDDCFDLDIPSYREKYEAVRAGLSGKYPDFELLFGMELGLQPHLAKEHKKLVSENRFDFIIASSHTIDGADPYYPEFFDGRSEEESYRRYFESILENLELFDDFDVYGHLDYIVRYGPNKDKYYSYEAYSTEIDAILKKLISMGKGIEINTGGLREGMRSTNPCFEVLKRYREFGGEIITIGSDAHKKQSVGYAFDEAVKLLIGAGFDRYCVFRNREKYFEKIDGSR